MLVTAFNGSPRKNGNTALMIKEALKVLESEGIETRLVQVGGNLVHGCIGCGKCRELKRCVFTDDPMNEWIEAMVQADGIILGSPTYFANMTTEMKALIDRAGYVLRPQGVLDMKVGAPVVVARRGGAMQTWNGLMAFFGINNMVVPMSNYWMGIGRMPGDVEDDAEGMEAMRRLGENMAFVLKKLHG